MNLVSSIIVFLLLCIGCSKGVEGNVVYLERIPVRNLKGEVMDVPDLEDPSRVYFRDSALFFKDNMSKDAQMYVYDFRTGVTYKHIKFGRGPGEMLGAFYFAFIDSPEATLVYDVTADNILIADTDSLRVEGYHPKEYYTSCTLDRRVSCITGYGDKLVCLGGKDAWRVVELQVNDSVKVVSSYSPDLESGKKDDLTMSAYEGVIKASKARQVCVIACRYSDQIEIVDLNTRRPMFVKGYDNFEPGSKVVWVKGFKTLSHDPEERKGYVDVCCADDFIVALYSGRKTKEINSSYGRNLRLLSWNGELIDEFILDRDIISIDIDAESGLLYAIADSSQIVRYQLR